MDVKDGRVILILLRFLTLPLYSQGCSQSGGDRANSREEVAVSGGGFGRHRYFHFKLLFNQIFEQQLWLRNLPINEVGKWWTESYLRRSPVKSDVRGLFGEDLEFEDLGSGEVVWPFWVSVSSSVKVESWKRQHHWWWWQWWGKQQQLPGLGTILSNFMYVNPLNYMRDTLLLSPLYVWGFEAQIG